MVYFLDENIDFFSILFYSSLGNGGVSKGVVFTHHLEMLNMFHREWFSYSEGSKHQTLWLSFYCLALPELGMGRTNDGMHSRTCKAPRLPQPPTLLRAFPSLRGPRPRCLGTSSYIRLISRILGALRPTGGLRDHPALGLGPLERTPAVILAL